MNYANRLFELMLSLSLALFSGRISATELALPKAIHNAFRIAGAAYGNTAIGVDSAGNVYIAGQFIGAVPTNGFPVASKTSLGPVSGHPEVFVAKFSPAGDALLQLTEFNDSNGQYDRFGNMVVEPDGSVVLTGGTQAPDFPTTTGSYQPQASNGGAFLLKLDPSGRKIVFSTFLDNSTDTWAESIAVSPDGTYYVGGITEGKTFPTTNDAFQRSIPSGTDGAGFVSRFSADGTTLLASTLFNDTAAPFFHGVSQLAVDQAGSVHLLGSGSLAVLDATLSKLTLSVPISSPSLLQVDQNGDSYVVATPSSNYALTKFSPTGKALFSVPIAAYPTGFVVLDDGAIVLAGGTYQVNFPTQNTLMPCNMNVPHDTVPVQWWVISAALIVLDPDGNVINASFLGGGAPPGYGNDGTSLDAIAKDRNGMIHLAGSGVSPEFPGGPILIPGPANLTSFSFALDLSEISERTGPAPACLAFSAPWGPVEAPVVPAMFMSLFGSNLGPASGVAAQFDSGQNVPMEVAGVRLTVGGLPAPILYVQDSRIDFIVPHEITGPTTQVCVIRVGVPRAGRPADEVESCLFAYVGDMDGALLPNVLNEDGPVNSASNPASPGSVVSFFGMGFGIFDPQTVDGALTGAAIANSRYTVDAEFTYSLGYEGNDIVPGNVLYFGTAPGLQNGVAQLNVRLPDVGLQSMATMSVTVHGGTVPAFPLHPAAVLVYVHP
jgi:uncharacterized protein (TIGR03437 family)